MINVVSITPEEASKVIQTQENHFADVKSILIAPASLTKSIYAFTNAEGGELYIGLDEDRRKKHRSWTGFDDPEAANGHIRAFEDLFPLGDGYSYTFLENDAMHGLVLKVEIGKSRQIKPASNGTIYLRRGAQNLPVTNAEELERLRRNKGLVSFETETIPVGLEAITNSLQVIEFMLEVVPASEPEPWLRKQQLIIDDKPTVADLLLFADEPQSILQKRSGIKVYKYNTKAKEGTRETLAFDPISIEGSAYRQIFSSIDKTVEIIESIRIMTPKGLQPAHYPRTAIHEVITNAVIHRDYSILDDIHVRIFDNRVEVLSPGTLPAHITVDNILSERYARNGIIVRLINKFPNAPNKDVGEGLNTAFDAMRNMNLKDPVISQSGEYVRVELRHELLGTPQELIMQFLDAHEFIANREARAICNIDSENRMKHILQGLTRAKMLEVVKGKTVFDTKYRKGPG